MGNQETGYGQTNCQIYSWDAEDKGLDLVEGSSPSETEKETADAVGAGNVEGPGPTANERE
jgi:hypothetical protein